MSDKPSDKGEGVLRKQALGYPGVKEEIACKGTKVESAVFRAKKKSFLFLGNGVIRLRLHESLGEAEKLAKKDPARYSTGVGGWVKVVYKESLPIEVAVLKKWVAESFAASETTKKRTSHNGMQSRSRSGFGMATISKSSA